MNSENTKRRSIFKQQNQKLKHTKLMENNYHILDLVRAFSSVESGELNLVLTLAKALSMLSIFNLQRCFKMQCILV